MRRDEPGRWASVAELFHQALETPSERRAAFLDEQCAGDEALRREVGSLLDAHTRAQTFLEAPAATARDLLAEGDAGADADAMVGRQVGHYEIRDVLGRGGMGVVYRAEDTRLGRQVALKALPAALAGDAQRRERLRREARAAAALSHPGIAVVYALEEIEDRLYIASELVPGRTLRDELADGPLPFALACQTATEVSRALAAAHARGVVHRDLKPENVIRTPNGGVKILDFGLARVAEGDERGPKLTVEGLLIGTPAYMAPEQLRGEPVDARADVFAFGVVFYELLTGAAPFAGPDLPSIVARVLDAEPRGLTASAVRGAADAATVRAVDAIIMRCLRKHPEARYESAVGLAAALDAMDPDAAGVDAGRAARGSPPGRALWWWRFHLSAASTGHVLLLIPLWLSARQYGQTGLALFVPAMAAAIAGGLVRLHLLFAQRSYPQEAGDQRQRAKPWVTLADAALAAATAAAGLVAMTAGSGFGLPLVAAAVAVFVVSTVVEPATTRAAFGRFGVR